MVFKPVNGIVIIDNLVIVKINTVNCKWRTVS